MIRRILIALAVWFLRRHSPAHLAQSGRRRHRPLPTTNEANQRRWFAEIDERAASREGR